MDIEFEDLTFRVRDHFWQKYDSGKCILKSVSGRFQAGHLSAILGHSGAGKSSLLNAVSGYRSTGVVAKSFKVNGQIRDEKLFRKLSCYITQEEVLQPMLTLEEVMGFAAQLKLESTVTNKQKKLLINEILSMLGLTECRNTCTDMLSGGQKKRLSIALELLNNPPVIFLDEPTSGLDNVSTTYTLKLLRRLAHQGRTVVCTIHQPSASLFQLFEDVYVLCQGKCVYQGATDQLVPFLTSIGYNCPTHYNPADFIIELTDSDHEQNVEILAMATENGNLCRTKSGVIKITEDYSTHLEIFPSINVELNNNTEIDPLCKFRDEDNNLSFAILEKQNGLMHVATNATFPTSAWSQFCVLWCRMTLQILRNKIGLKIQFYHHLLCAIAIGAVFFDKAKDGSNFFDHLKFCLGIVVFHTFTYCMMPVIQYPFEVKLLRREHFNRWYSLKPYYFALQFSRVPTLILFNMIFLTIMYFMVGLPMQLNRFFSFCALGILISFTAEGMGYAIGAVFNVTNGSAVAPLTLAPFLGLATYGFDFAREIPWYISFLMKTSFLRNGVVGVIITVFGMGREPLQCLTQVYCHFQDPKTLMEYLDIENSTAWIQIAYLICILLVFRISTFVALKTKLSS